MVVWKAGPGQIYIFSYKSDLPLQGTQMIRNIRLQRSIIRIQRMVVGYLAIDSPGKIEVVEPSVRKAGNPFNYYSKLRVG